MTNTSKRKALGKGLGALIPTARTEPRPAATGGFIELSIDRLVPNEDQPRQSFDEGKLRELTESVRSRGVLQPLVVRERSDGDYQIVAGERRWRAARLAGLRTVPVVVKDLTDADMLEVALIENLQREDLNPLEEAEAYRALVEEHGLTQERLAERVGRQRSTVANALRLLKLPDEVQRYLLTGELTMGHARALLGLASSSAVVELARRVVRDRISVRACEELVRDQGAARAAGKRPRTKRNHYTPAQQRLVESMQRHLGTKVELRAGRKGGRVIIHYFVEAELQRVLEVIEGR